MKNLLMIINPKSGKSGTKKNLLDACEIFSNANYLVNIYYSMPNKPKGKSVSVSISVSTFVPKPFTPFQFEPQIDEAEIRRRQEYLKSQIPTKKISLSYHDSSTSFLEGVFAPYSVSPFLTFLHFTFLGLDNFRTLFLLLIHHS